MSVGHVSGDFLVLFSPHVFLHSRFTGYEPHASARLRREEAKVLKASAVLLDVKIAGWYGRVVV